MVWVISYSWSEWLNPYYDRHELGSGVTCLLTGWVKDFPCRRILDWGVTCLLAGREKSFLLWITMCKYSNSNLPLAEHVPPNRLLFGGTVPPTRKLFGGTVPLYSKLFGRTVPPNNFLFGGTVQPNRKLFGGIVPPNSLPHNKCECPLFTDVSSSAQIMCVPNLFVCNGLHVFVLVRNASPSFVCISLKAITITCVLSSSLVSLGFLLSLVDHHAELLIVQLVIPTLVKLGKTFLHLHNNIFMVFMVRGTKQSVLSGLLSLL